MESTYHQLSGTALGTCIIREPIGAGGMGAVYLARQTRPVRDVAVKVLRPSVATQQEFLARFRREADVVAKLDHVNIMPIYEYGEQNGLAYLVMPYLTGGSLRDKLAQRGTLSFGETLAYIEQAASALDYAHAQKIIHRDIKPGNFLFHADGRLVLADFGIAHLVRESSTDVTLTGTGQFLGSPEYMAPEMVYGEPVDARTDVYELGIVLFQMLSGRVPFGGTSPYVIATKHVQEVPPPLSQMNPSIPLAVDAVVRKAIAKRPEDRFTSAGQLAQAFRTAIVDPHSIPVDIPFSPSTFLATPPPIISPRDVPSRTYPSGNLASMRNSGAIPVVSQHLPPTPSRGMPGWLAWLAIACLALLTIGGGSLIGLKVFGQQTNVPPTVTLAPKPTTAPSPTPSPTSTATPIPQPSPSQQAQHSVQRYYDAINQSDYQTAYQLWGSNYKSAHSYSDFASGYANTIRDDVIIAAVTPLSDGTVKVDITLYANERAASGPTVQEYQGYYIVGQENGGWKLLTASIQPIGTSANNPPTQSNQAQAQNVILSYYSYINQHDYQDAYQLWKDASQDQQAYNQFASGYANTEHVDVTINNTTQQSDGSFSLDVTLRSTDSTSSGPVTKIYQATYIVGQQNGSWKIFSGKAQQVG